MRRMLAEGAAGAMGAVGGAARLGVIMERDFLRRRGTRGFWDGGLWEGLERVG